ncbi:MAG TPA: sulfur carrier protein ThiS [Acidimicrobiales bacterium]|nr:sulfur carrier protein ThiS [Acidimicrobiales bacterium]
MIRVNGKDDAFFNESVEALLSRLGIEPRGIAVALDGEVVRRSAWLDTVVADGSSVEIVTAAAGG